MTRRATTGGKADKARRRNTKSRQGGHPGSASTLRKQLVESLEQQAATSEILKVISSSPGELESVFQAILENATRLCAAKFGILYLREGDAFRTAATFNLPLAFAETRKRGDLIRPSPLSMLGRLVMLGHLINSKTVFTFQTLPRTKLTLIVIHGLSLLLTSAVFEPRLRYRCSRMEI